MSFDWTAIEQEAQKEINRVSSGEAIEALRIKYLGRQGLLAEITGSISSLSASERPEFGKKANYLKNKLTQLLEERVSQLKENESQGFEAFDLTLPGEPIPQTGTLHPITQTIQEITAIFSKMGFVAVEGPEVENEYNNFSGLNIPLDHPSRDAFDTFYIKSPSHQVT
ncbi:MAG TPA: phenylalanine--tRNA ligase subunit alpha, partial [Candidatus Omnitrophica bacterium]|nr:phenylalanine--tRNA ligase subunit alpha [Candidatus Omnitrophota bacterium]